LSLGGEARAGIERLAPTRFTSHLASGELDQIQFLLGHVSIQTTERYLGCKEKGRSAVNDRLGIVKTVEETLAIFARQSNSFWRP